MSDPKQRHDTLLTMTAVPVREVISERRCFLMVLDGPDMGTLHSLEVGRDLVLGRSDEAVVRVNAHDVSREHASLRVIGERLELRDLDSRNGTFVEGERIAARTLRDGDRFRLGGGTTLKFVVYDETEEQWARRLADGALRDALTGVYNRRYLAERVLGEVEASRRFGEPLSLLLMDIDHFKRVNDTHGHGAGDEVLRVVSRTIGDSLRRSDTLARYGGEEFVVLARGTSLPGATRLAERLRAKVADTTCIVERALRVTISIGVAELTAVDTDKALLERADAALYDAKDSGRNRVAIAGPALRAVSAGEK